ncbi:MAG: peptidoglycan synthetase [Chitinophagales bacterium]|nr:peptidoglycan synthetase [Chitinophagales bacterium]
MRIHFIAIGGSIMHQLAITLKEKGFSISGSDDKIYDPAYSNLKNNGILPEEIGFFPEKISEDIDAVILGMHAKVDNPELAKARDLGVNIYSFPEYIYQQSKDKKRVVIAGSHGKTTITSMIMHVLRYWKCDFDFLVGASIKGFKTSVKLTDSAPVIILEGDEYLSSPIDRVPKFLYYKPQLALISGIAWDHINVFPTYSDYYTQFIQFVSTIMDNGTLVYNTEDPAVRKLALLINPGVNKFPYHTPGYIVEENKTYLNKGDKKIPLKIFGGHNLNNLQGARIICNELGISDDDFYIAIQTFEGAAKRLELINKGNSTSVYKDFAHAPSKVKASISAVKAQYSGRELVAMLELHTFSSLNENFIGEYKGSMIDADLPIVYFDEAGFKAKGIDVFTEEQVREAFKNDSIRVFTSQSKLESYLREIDWKGKNLLMMSSGNYAGLNLKEIADFIIYKQVKNKVKSQT